MGILGPKVEGVRVEMDEVSVRITFPSTLSLSTRLLQTPGSTPPPCSGNLGGNLIRSVVVWTLRETRRGVVREVRTEKADSGPSLPSSPGVPRVDRPKGRVRTGA